MNSSFYTALTGAKSHQVAVDTTSNNIANINTIGYRGSVTEFATLYSKTLAVNYETQVSDQGLGSRVSATAIDMRSGAYQQTDNTFDVAIDGNGWFGVTASNTMDAQKVAYTRNGTFSRDENGHLVTQGGNYVLGSSYGNLVNVNGAWQVDPTVSAGGLSTVTAQGQLFIPTDLNYPPVATKTAALNANLPGTETSRTTVALSKTDLAALFDRNGAPINIKTGENLLIAAGGETLDAADGVITLSKTVPDNLSGPLSLNINNTTVAADWPDNSDGETIAAAIALALNASGAVQASADGAILSLSSGGSLSLTPLDTTGFFTATAGSIVTYGSEEGEIQTLDDLRSTLESTLQAVYGEGVSVDYRYDGTLAIASSDAVKMQIGEADESNAAFLSALSNLSGYESTGLTTPVFKQAWNKSAQDIVSPEGEKLRLQTELRMTTPASNENAAVWEAEASIQQQGNATASSDLGWLSYNNEPIDLKGGEDLWFAFGKTPAKTDLGYGYSVTLASDEAEGTAPTLALTVDGETFSITGEDGADVLELRSQLETVLNAAGYPTTQSGTNLIIHPKEGNNLIVSGGTTNLEGITYDPMSLGRIVYGESGITTLAQMADRVNEIAAPLSAVAAFNNGQLVIENNGASQISASVLSGDNTPAAFRNLFSSLNTALASGASAQTDQLSAWNVLSSQSGLEVSFDSSGAVLSPNTITLDNGGTPLSVTLNLTAWQGSAQSASIKADGVVAGRLDGYDIDQNGAIVASFTNAESAIVGQIAVYHFINDQGLMRIGDNQFMRSENSGEAFFWLDSSGKATPGAIIENRMLEGSNVQSATALSELIIYQRAYEGNAKAITTSDELIKNAIQMKK